MGMQEIGIELNDALSQFEHGAHNMRPDEVALFLRISSKALVNYIRNSNEQLAEDAPGYINPIVTEKIQSIFSELSNNLFSMAHTNEPLEQLKIIDRERLDQIIIIFDELMAIEEARRDQSENLRHFDEERLRLSDELRAIEEARRNHSENLRHIDLERLRLSDEIRAIEEDRRNHSENLRHIDLERFHLSEELRRIDEERLNRSDGLRHIDETRLNHGFELRHIDERRSHVSDGLLRAIEDIMH
jgi:chromosome segregation ATPase